MAFEDPVSAATAISDDRSSCRAKRRIPPSRIDIDGAIRRISNSTNTLRKEHG